MLVIASVPMIFASCATGPTSLAAVGPRPTVIPPNITDGTGHLVVFTGTEEKNLGKEARYYLYTPYVIRTANDEFYKRVPNHFGNMDQAPQFVTLPAGVYHILAQSETYGMVTLPVIIATGRTTEIHLEGRWKPKNEPAKDEDIVRLPNGQQVGWRSDLAANGSK